MGKAAVRLCVALALLAIGRVQVDAQVLPPPPGFVPPYEVMRTVRATGLDPLAPPLREGTTYVLRATDYRGVLMRVVVDANTGTIRAVNRIVPPIMPGQIGMMPPRYGAPPADVLPPYGPPPEFDAAPPPPAGQAALPPPPFASRPSATLSGTQRNVPLPRPRPTALASRKPAGPARSEIAPPGGAGQSTAASTAEAKSPVDSELTTASPPRPSAAKPAKPLPGPPIND